MRRLPLVFLVIITALASGCAAVGDIFNLPLPAARLVPQVIATYPHDPTSFLQGLEFDGERLFEGSGLYGESTLREVDLESGEVLRSVALDEQYFGEGITLVGDRIYQLTWREGTVFVYDRDTFERIGTFSNPTEGWGLCYDEPENVLYMTDGSANLYRVDPETFTLIEALPVSFNGQPVAQLNELECVGDYVYVNVWQTDFILRLDKHNGRISAVIDARGLLPDEIRAGLDSGAVLNGIAYRPETGTFIITGKLWPLLFEVRFAG